MIKNFGFIRSEIDDTQYIFGASPLLSNDINPSGDWEKFLPDFEYQAEGYETYGCVPYGTENAVQTLMNFHFGTKINYSERFAYNLASIVPPGSDPHFVNEIMRKYGFISQERLPRSSTLEEFKKPRPMTTDYLSLGQDWLKHYTFGHDWVFTNSPNKQARISLLQSALKKGTVCISVTAWWEVNGLFVDNGQPNTHWTQLYKIDDDGTMYVFDSYALIMDGVPLNAKKKLSPDHHIEMAKRYTVTIKDPTAQQKSLWDTILELWAKVFNLENVLKKDGEFIKPPLKDKIPEPLMPSKLDKLYDISRSYLGQHLTLDTAVPIRLGCAESVSFILKKCGYDIPYKGIPGTYTLYEWLQKNFTEIPQAEKGCIVISPTTVEVGHVGVVGAYNYMYKDDYAVMSNNSDNGIYDTDWRLKNWKEYYGFKRGLKVLFFKPK